MEEFKWDLYPVIGRYQSQFPIRNEHHEDHQGRPLEIPLPRGSTQREEFRSLNL